MFKKVLIAEDHEMTNISVRKTLGELGITDTQYVYYCDHAFTWLRNAERSGAPFDLLITDIYFEEDEFTQRLTDGPALIEAARAVQPNLKVIVFSAENRPAVIDGLFKTLQIDGYVRKARRDSQHLKEAIDAIAAGMTYLPPDIKRAVKSSNTYEFSHFDVTIIKLLADGTRQKDIPTFLKQQNIKPAGLSSVEKRLNQMKEALEFSKNEQLIAHCKDMGII